MGEPRQQVPGMSDAAQFIGGVILGPLIVMMAIGLPLILGVGIVTAAKLGDTAGLFSGFASAVIGATLCAGIGSALGRRPEISWALIIGAEVAPLAASMRVVPLLVWSNTLAWGLFGSYVFGSVALALGFRHGRRDRPAPAPSPTDPTPVEQALQADKAPVG